MEKYKTYVREFQGNNKAGLYFIDNQLSKHLQKNPENQTEIEHILDYLYSSNKKFKIGYATIKEKARKWSQKLQSVAVKDNEEVGVDIQILKEWDNGFKVVKLLSENSYKREGKLMSHCVASFYEKKVDIYSLRDEKNLPHCTFEGGNQIKGKGNGAIIPKYIKYVVEFIEEMGFEVSSSEMKNLGYVNVSEIEDKNAVFPSLFRDKYFYKSNIDKVTDKKGKKYQNMSMWECFGLFEISHSFNIRFNFDINLSVSNFIKSISRLKTKTNTGNGSASTNTGNRSASTNTGNGSASTNTGNRSASTNTGDWSASTNTGNGSASTNTGNRSASTNTGDWSASTNTGYQSASTNTGNGSASTNTGNRSASTNTGNGSASTNTGDWSASTNTGNGSASTNTGNRSASTNTGNGSASTNTGNRSASTNTGNGSASTNTGNRSASTNTGNGSASTNTGDWSASKTEGLDSIAIVTGFQSRASGALGNYIILTERCSYMKILGVKALKVDGKKIKPDVFYALKNGKVCEWNNQLFNDV